MTDELADQLDRTLRTLDPQEDSRTSRTANIRRNDSSMVLGSLVPDLVIENLDKKTHSLDAVLLMADVSGFTELCDKYSKNSIRASSQITEIINIYMGEMVKVIYECKGDVVNYSGDAILALWKIEGEDDSPVVAACDCSIYIQERIGEYVTQVNTLRVKLTVTSGNVHYLMVGDDNKRDFILFGPGIMVLKSIEKYSKAGKTLITSYSITKNMRKRFKFESLDVNEVHQLLGYKVGASENFRKFKQEGGVDYLIYLRPALRKIQPKEAEIIKLFMMSAVSKAVEKTGKVEQTTEMRNVVIAFINIITTQDTMMTDLSDIIEQCYLTISRVVIKMEGDVNKFSLFDKDLMFLVVFGLRYYKGSITEKTSLKCAREVKAELERVHGVKSASIGVTSGTVYCGVVGHPVRREFTVIGLKVNMAARLMVAYPDKIVCDRETFLHSRIDYTDFILQEPKYLKGISNIGPIYMFAGQDKEENMLLKSSTNFPLLGRDKEIKVFQHILSTAFSKRNVKQKSVVAYMGESGQGKTRILEEVRIICQDRYFCLLVDLQQGCLDIPYSGFQEICRGPLGLTENTSIYDRESRIYNLLKGEDYDKNYICLLNRIFNVNFEYSQEYFNASGEIKEINLRKLVVLVMKTLTGKPTVLIIDNAEYMDSISWLLLYDITQLHNLITVLSVGTKAELFPLASDMLKMKHVTVVKLNRMDQEYLIGLACQMLSVDAIPYDLLLKIHHYSEGNPGWIEGFLLICIQSGYLNFRDDTSDLLMLEKLVKAPVHMKKRGYNSTLNKLAVRISDMASNQNEQDIIKACVISNQYEHQEFSLNRESRIITIFYQFNLYMKQILKYCAAFGDLIPRDGLRQMLDDADEINLCSAIKLLFEKKILGCATKTHAYDLDCKVISRKRLLNFYREDDIECICPQPEEVIGNGPKYAHCDFLRFISHEFKHAINVLLTHGEKREYHSKIIMYFFKLSKECKTCRSHESRWKLKGVENVLQLKFNIEDSDTPGKILMGNYDMAHHSQSPNKDATGFCVTRTLRYSYVNLSDCRCHLIRLKFNDHFIHHCLEGQIIEAAINVILDNALLYLTISDGVQASRMTEMAAEHLIEISKNIKEPYTWKVVCASALINLLRGLCKYKMGHVKESITFYHKSLAELGCVFPESKYKILYNSVCKYITMKLLILHGGWHHSRLENKSHHEITVILLITENLISLSHSYRMVGQKKLATLASLWAFSKAYKVRKCNFFVLTSAVANVICLASKMNMGYFYVNLREFAEKIAIGCAQEATLMELRGILYMYRALIDLSLSKGELDESIEYCHVALGISLPVQEFESKLRLIPRMVVIYTLKLDINAAITKLVEYESIMNSDVDGSSRIWYVAIIMYIALHCGIELMSFQSAKNFLGKGGKLTVVKDLESEMVLSCCMWLHALRRKDWMEASSWIPPLINRNDWDREYPITVIILAYEGLLLQYSRVINVTRYRDLVKKINYFEKHLSTVIKFNMIWKPRYLHLTAYYHKLEHMKASSKRKMAQAENLAESQGNNLELLCIASDRLKWVSDPWTGHNIKQIDPIVWKGRVFNQVTVYNLPIDDLIY